MFAVIFISDDHRYEVVSQNWLLGCNKVRLPMVSDNLWLEALRSHQEPLPSDREVPCVVLHRSRKSDLFNRYSSLGDEEEARRFLRQHLSDAAKSSDATVAAGDKWQQRPASEDVLMFQTDSDDWTPDRTEDLLNPFPAKRRLVRHVAGPSSSGIPHQCQCGSMLTLYSKILGYLESSGRQQHRLIVSLMADTAQIKKDVQTVRQDLEQLKAICAVSSSKQPLNIPLKTVEEAKELEEKIRGDSSLNDMLVRYTLIIK